MHMPEYTHVELHTHADVHMPEYTHMELHTHADIFKFMSHAQSPRLDPITVSHHQNENKTFLK